MKKLILLLLTFITLHVNAQLRDTYSDTWVAVDDLNRATPDNSLTGGVKTGKTVGLFYYIWLQETSGWNIYDISKILAGKATWGGSPSFHHYGESIFNYYSSADEFVIRKHMQMFADAGVDYIFLDNTNGEIYETVQVKLLNLLLTMKAEGINVPEVSWAMYNGDMNTEIEKLYDKIATNATYQSLFFKWNGKPLLLGEYTGSRTEIKNYFTIKKSWAWTSQPWFKETAGKDRWPWLDDYPQKPGLSSTGAVEQMTVAAAHHPHGQYAIGKSTGADRTQAPVLGNDGKYFKLQWDRALQVDPPMIMITQWNEWIAQRFIKGGTYNQPIDYMARKPIATGESQFVDVYTPEYSRDLEPMRTGYRDNMYLQMVSNIRKYKGTRAFRKSSNPVPIVMNNTFSQWSSVGPQYLDDKNDVTARNHVSFGSDLTYTNTTGRNDLLEMKVSFDNTYVYFYAKTTAALTAHTDARWMNLLINSDANYGTGWEGYDYIVNNTVNSATSTTLKKNSGGTFTWGSAVNVDYSYSGNQIQVRIPASSLGINTANPFTLDFKWFDNSIQTGDIIDAYVNGDAAPNNRFNYRYIGAGTGLTAWEFNTAGNVEGWTMQNNITGTVSGGALNATITGTDPYMLSPTVNVSANNYSFIYLRVKNTTSQTSGEFYWTTNLSGSYDGTKRVTFTLPPNDGLFHDIVIDLSSNVNWINTITGIRIDPTGAGSSGSVSFDHISFEPIDLLDCNDVWGGTSKPVTPTLSIAITSGVNPGCAGDALTFTATRTNGGSAPAYQWKVNGVNAGTNSATFTSTTLANTDVVTCVLTSNAVCATPSTATSNAITLTRYTNKVPAVSIAITTGSNPSCAGSAQTFTATPTNGGTAPTYQWQVNGVSAGSNSATFTSSALANASVVKCIMTTDISCYTTPTATSNSITLTRTANLTPSVTIALTAGTNPSCAGSSQTFTASPVNGGTTPVYQWMVNGVNAGTNSSTYTSSTLTNASAVTCKITSNLACTTTPSAVSNSITVTRTANVTPTVSIALTSGTNPSCAGTSQTFTASPVNGGTAPVYQWMVNGVNAGTNSSTYTSSTLTNASAVTCKITSNLACTTTPSAVSNSITVTRTANVTPTVSIALTSGTNPSCEGTSQTFTASPANGGTNPVYQWTINGVNTGTNNAIFTSSTLATASIVKCTLTSNMACTTTPTATSNSITLTRTANVTPNVVIGLSTGTNPSCAGETLTYTATPTNGGTTPAYQWKINGVNAGTNSTTFSSSNLIDNDAISVVLTSNASCSTTGTITSNTLTQTVKTIPIANAGADQNVTTNAAVLSGNTPASGVSGTWTTTGSAIINLKSDPHSEVNNLEPGVNTFRWTLSNGTCSVYDEVQINLATVTGISSRQIAKNTYTVYPNPFSEEIKFIFESTATEKIRLVISDTKGAVVYSSEEFFTNQDIIINQEMPVGVLLVQVLFGEEIKRFKIVKISH